MENGVLPEWSHSNDRFRIALEQGVVTAPNNVTPMEIVVLNKEPGFKTFVAVFARTAGA